MKAYYNKYLLNFNKPAGTSRGILNQKETWFLYIEAEDRIGVGECALFRGLSIDDTSDYEDKLIWLCKNIDLGKDLLYQEMMGYPSIQFGIEMAFTSLGSNDPFVLYPSDFVLGKQGIPINGLIWMGDIDFMKSQVSSNIAAGYRCLKLKIGAIDFESEMELLNSIRSEYSSSELELRVDANGAFSFSEALEKLNRLAELDLHSIEQPIKAGNWESMARLCESSPIDIALDEELIGLISDEERQRMLQSIRPKFIILKPSLIGGWTSSNNWIELADSLNIDWWVTSALESNIGLNAISQFTFTKNSKLLQGLGTGNLFTNNIDSPLNIDTGSIHYNPDKNWDLKFINSIKKE